MKTRLVTRLNVVEIESAISNLRAARLLLVQAGAKKSAAKVRRALKSAEGALRHADGINRRQARSFIERLDEPHRSESAVNLFF
jgi:hypothetical protein